MGFISVSIIPFIIGVPYLALILVSVMGQKMTFTSALEIGLLPFIFPGLIKAVAAALIIPGAWLLVRAADRTKEM